MPQLAFVRYLVSSVLLFFFLRGLSVFKFEKIKYGQVISFSQFDFEYNDTILLDGQIRRLYLKVQRLTVYHFKNVF